MAEECLMCVGPASDRYTLVFEPGRVLEDVVVCEDCISDVRAEDWIEVHDAPVLKRGGDNPGQEEEDRSNSLD